METVIFKNYLKIAIRHIVKHKMNGFINIFGLAMGITAAVMILLYARNELTYDAFHRNAENIFLVYKERPTPTGTQLTYDTWLPMAEALKAALANPVEALRYE
jgi:putative ABC transport system permease protein